MTLEKDLFRALFEPNKNRLIELIELYKIDINKYTDFSSQNSILIESLLCKKAQQGTTEQLEIITYLINKNVDLNWKNKSGFNALHIALAHHELSKISLLLIKNDKMDIHVIEDKNGNSPIFIAIREYGKTWREEQKELNQLRFEIINVLLKRGADLDKINHSGISSRRWNEISNDKRLHDLIEKHDAK